MTGLTILHLYPHELGINGDRGNVTVLARRARWRGAEAIVIEHSPGSGELPDADLIVVGSGPLSAQRIVQADLLEHAGRLRDLVSGGAALLAVSGGMHLLGTELQLEDGSVLQGAGVLPIRTVLTAKRSVGDLVVETPAGVLVGYENHGSLVTLEGGAQPLGTVRNGFGNGGAGGGEGVRVGSAIGTHLGGPVLALNPSLADDLLTAALARNGATLPATADEPTAQIDDWARLARETVESHPSSY
jgi:CobQ-like glutamine amidotransferase family enzyme